MVLTILYDNMTDVPTAQAGENHIKNENYIKDKDGISQLESIKQQFSSQIEDCMSSAYRLALRLTRHNADAEDLLAESIEKAWKAYGSLEDRTKFRTWLLRIVHNCFISQYRKKSVRPTEESWEDIKSDDQNGDITTILFHQPEEFLLWWANPEKVFLNRILGEDIYKAIEQLPEVYRMAVILVNIEGLGYDEAAAVLDVPTGTIRSRMKRGRTLLQKNLWQHAKHAGLIDESEPEGGEQ